MHTIKSVLHVQAIEGFHLAVLRALEAKLDRSRWVVKGGLNLRAWFGSERYSEDMDIDAVGIAPHLLKEKVDKVLAGAVLRDLLALQRLRIVRSSAPKQTETTQRWKLEIAGERIAVALHTRLEFSRRGSDDAYILEPVRADIVRAYKIPAPTANHYTASSAARQKIRALAQRSAPQARDVWDLEHLLRTANVDEAALGGVARLVPRALERLAEISFDLFKAQVVPYLEPEHHAVHGTRDAWSRKVELVRDRLQRIRGEP
jgi:predicted nucleotidyltransferase component of viral defense system